jgi:GT2 family glycosyltransferase
MISVGISTYGRPARLRTCLETLIAGTEVPAEIVIVDQSEDGETRRLVEATDGPLTYVHHSPPSISGARNHAVEVARGEYVAIVDDDCELPSGWLQAVEAELDRHRFPDALFGAIRDAEPDPTGKLVPVSMYEPPAQAREWEDPVNPCAIGFGAHMILKRETFLALGGFDERLGPGAELLGAEDVDLTYRLLKHGCRVVSSPAIWVVHRPAGRPPRFFFGRNFGFAAFCAKHLHDGDRFVWRMLASQARNDLKMLASAVRRRSWYKARVSYWMATGTWRGLVRGWLAYR